MFGYRNQGHIACDELTFDYTENETNIAYPFVDKMTQKYVK